jgi:SAM-dependent methyltransferase
VTAKDVSDTNHRSTERLYLASAVEKLAENRRLSILDLGCGAGTHVLLLASLGHDAYGCDFERSEAERRERLTPVFGDAYPDHTHITRDEAAIPFGDSQFDVVVANQVFEHVRLFDRMVGECARVLKPDGVLLATLPLATTPVELHVKVPFVHWLPPGPLRRKYLTFFGNLGLGRLQEGMTAEQSAAHNDQYLATETYYRFLNEILAVGDYYFKECTMDTSALIAARLEAAARENGGSRHVKTRIKAAIPHLIQQTLGEAVATSLLGGAFLMRAPRKDRLVSGQ